jgi:ribosome-binding protein aMBF1 (putative translation factor)
VANIQTADYHIKKIDQRQRQVQRERRQFLDAQKRLEDYRDLRDDVVSVIRNSGLSYEDIHAKCGPHPSTLVKWETKQVDAPRLGKMRAVLRICGADLGIVYRK